MFFATSYSALQGEAREAGGTFRVRIVLIHPLEAVILVGRVDDGEKPGITADIQTIQSTQIIGQSTNGLE